MNPNIFLWVLLSPHGSLLVPIRPFVSLCDFMRPCGSLWVLIGPYAS